MPTAGGAQASLGHDRRSAAVRTRSRRNIIAERILGLPKEPELDKNVPFRDVLKSPAVR